jgi:hypothetical protein
VLDPAVELVGVRERRLGEDDPELVAADAACDVGRAHGLPQSLGDGCQHRIAGEMPDPVVDRLEVVDVEDDEREVAVVARRARALALERLVEVAPVVEARQRVEVGLVTRLAEPAGVLDRGRRAPPELLQLAHLAVREAAARVAREDGERADRARVEREWDGEPGMDHAAVRVELGLVVSVGDRDGAREAPVRWAGDETVALRLVRRQPQRDDERVAVEPVREPDDGGVSRRHARSRLEGALEHVVEVERARELAEDARAPPVGLRALERRAELPHHLLHACVEVADGRRDALVRTAVGTTARPDDEERDEEHEDGAADCGEDEQHHRGIPSRSRTDRTLVRLAPGIYDLQPGKHGARGGT